MQAFYSAVFAGALTGLGGGAYLGAGSREAGGLLFSIGMFAALALGLPLYTGRCAGNICRHPADWRPLVPMALGNLLGAVLTGLVFGMSVPSGVEALRDLKLTQPFLATLARGTFCGMVIFSGAEAWKRLEHGKPVGVLLGVTAFVVGGYENSFADAFYFAAAVGQSGQFHAGAIPFVLAALIGNTLGAVLLYLALPEKVFQAGSRAA
ncbi:MAG TPA: formate/nitrite transporter family protein [Candidatus Limnocylindria bacterium]|nr:formate/nitrite transporter family protein [Candidatus Limnocylindria bacterium]